MTLLSLSAHCMSLNIVGFSHANKDRPLTFQSSPGECTEDYTLLCDSMELVPAPAVHRVPCADCGGSGFLGDKAIYVVAL